MPTPKLFEYLAEELRKIAELPRDKETIISNQFVGAALFVNTINQVSNH